MQQANSTDGLTSAMYYIICHVLHDVAPACSFMEMELIFKFLLGNLSVLSALQQMLFTCGFHLRSEVMVTPRYFTDVLCCRTGRFWSWRV